MTFERFSSRGVTRGLGGVTGWVEEVEVGEDVIGPMGTGRDGHWTFSKTALESKHTRFI